jgi:hypothetical protein
MTTSVEEIQKRMRDELSIGARLGHTAVAVSALAVTGVVTSLLLTEPNLPLRTQVGFVAIALGGLAWTGMALWVLLRRRVLFAQHRVVASRLALGMSVVFLIGAVMFRAHAGTAAIVVNAAMTLAAAVWAVRARRRLVALQRRRDLLEQGGAR